MAQTNVTTNPKIDKDREAARLKLVEVQYMLEFLSHVEPSSDFKHEDFVGLGYILRDYAAGLQPAFNELLAPLRAPHA